MIVVASPRSALFAPLLSAAGVVCPRAAGTVLLQPRFVRGSAMTHSRGTDGERRRARAGRPYLYAPAISP